MQNILYVSSSIRPETSHSHSLGRFFCDTLSARFTGAKVEYRNVGVMPPPHPDAAYSVANYTPPEQRTQGMKNALETSDQLIDQIFAADALVFSVPMYNFSIPSTFKAYIDNIVRVGRTFEFAPDGSFAGLLPQKKVLFVTSRGAVYGEGSPIKDFDMQEPYLRTVFGFMGIAEPKFIHADGMDFADDTYREQKLERAREQLSALAKSW